MAPMDKGVSFGDGVRPRYQPPFRSRPKFGESRDSSIKSAIAEKDRKIAKYVKDKDVGIVVNAAIRDAYMWCINHPDWKKEMSEEERRDWIDHVCRANIEFTASNKEDYESLYQEIKGAMEVLEEDRVAEIKDKELETANVEVGSDQFEEAPISDFGDKE